MMKRIGQAKLTTEPQMHENSPREFDQVHSNFPNRLTETPMTKQEHMRKIH